MRRIPFLFLPLVAFSCVSLEETQPTNPLVPKVEVRHWGSLPAMHRRGEVDALVSLRELLPDAHAIGLGARAGLWGEITVMGGTAFSAKTQGDQSVAFDAGSNSRDEACLLVWASVPDWQVRTVAQDVSLAGLGEFLAEEIGHDGPTPFRIAGNFQKLEWHVVDGPTAPGIEASCESHSEEGIQDRAQEVLRAELVGFYSQNHKAVFTRHDALHHTHVLVYDGEDITQTGHLDDVVVPAGSSLYLPH